MQYRNLLALLPILLLTACVVVIGDDDADFDIDDDDYHAVKHDNSDRVSNNDLAGRISDKIAQDAILGERDISVTSKNGIVYLHGEVFDSSEVQRAIDHAYAEEEVSAISSRLIVSVTK